MPVDPEEFGKMQSKLYALDRAIFGNGQQGLIADVADLKGDHDSFFKCWIQREEDKKKYDDHLKWMVGTCLALVLATLGLLAFLGIRAHLDNHAFVSTDSSITAVL